MKRNPRRGMSQLEVLIAIAVMTLISVLLANALNLSRQGLQRTQGLNLSSNMLIAREDLRAWVAAMPMNDARAAARDVFEGTSDGLRFRTWLDNTLFEPSKPVTVDVRMAVENSEAVVQLLASGRHPSEDSPVSVVQPLSQAASGLSIRYYGRRSSDTKRQWYDHWSDPAYLPDLVKIEWDREDGKPIPPLTLLPAKDERQRFISLSSLVPPG